MTTFTSGREFLASLARAVPDCVVLDVQMPEMSGLEVAAKLRIRVAHVGTQDLDLPLGRVFVEVSKGFEIEPLRKVMSIKRSRSSASVSRRPAAAGCSIS